MLATLTTTTTNRHSCDVNEIDYIFGAGYMALTWI